MYADPGDGIAYPQGGGAIKYPQGIGIRKNDKTCNFVLLSLRNIAEKVFFLIQHSSFALECRTLGMGMAIS